MSIIRRISDISKELDLAVHTLASFPEMNNRYVLGFVSFISELAFFGKVLHFVLKFINFLQICQSCS